MGVENAAWGEERTADGQTVGISRLASSRMRRRNHGGILIGKMRRFSSQPNHSSSPAICRQSKSTLAGITRHPTEDWMVQMARNAVDGIDGALLPVRFVLHDRDTKFCASFRSVLQSGGVQPIVLPPRRPNLNAFAERWVRSIKSECLSKLILFGEPSLRRAITEFLKHYHHERNHQGKANRLLFPSPVSPRSTRPGRIRYQQRLGGLLKFYSRAA